MRRFIQIAFGAWFAIAMSMAQACMTPPANAYTYSNPPPNTYTASGSGGAAGVNTVAAETHIDTRGYTADQSESKALTSYLTEHKLPLVGAQVLNSSDGRRAVVLYGFVGSEFGKSDAVAKTKRYLGDSSIDVDNRINVRPELLSANRPGNVPMPPPSSYDENNPGTSGYPGPRSYAEQQNPANQYQQFQNQGGAITSVLPLISLLGVLGMGLAGGGGGFGFGAGPSFGGGPFGYSPYGSFGGAYPGYPMASPFGVTPYGASPPGVPYTTAPFGGSPYGNSPPPFP